MSPRTRSRFGLLVALVVAASTGWTDGKIWSASGELPDMPKQRALVHWKAGVETLIVESDYFATSNDNTWLIPVPSRPDKIEALAPGALESLQAILPIPVPATPPSAAPALILLAASLYAAAIRRRCERFGRWFALTILPMALVAIPAGIFFPVFAESSKGVGSASSPTILQVGSYNVAVVSGLEEGDSVPNVPPALHSTLEQYRKEGWSVVVAQLRNVSRGLATPHPLRIRFRSAAPIYPMRLTGVNAEPLHLDLFVLGKDPATHHSLYRFFVREVGLLAADRWNPIGHPDLVPLLEPGQFLTRLSGILSRREMTRDLTLEWTPSDTTTVGAVDPRDIVLHLVIWGSFAGAAALLIISGLAFVVKALGPLSRVLVASLAVGAAFALTLYATTPKYDRGLSRVGYAAEIQARRIMSCAEEASFGKSAAECEKEFRRLLAKEGTPLERAVPGGFTLERTDAGVVVTAYDSLANPRREQLFGPKAR